MLANELPSVVSPLFTLETPTVASLLAIELPSIVSPPFAVETPTVSVLYSHKEGTLIKQHSTSMNHPRALQLLTIKKYAIRHWFVGNYAIAHSVHVIETCYYILSW